MARPKKKRLFDGLALEENLYPDNKGREGYWRYRRPDGSFKAFKAASAEEANAIARYNNDNRDQFNPFSRSNTASPEFGTLSFYIEPYVDFRENQSPELKDKSSWLRRKYALENFAKDISAPLPQITYTSIEAWWEELTGHQQRQRHAELRKFFNYLMGRGLLSQLAYNPFTTADDKPRLYYKSRPKRQSKRLTREGFWKIYAAAGELGYECLQIAMGISLLTFMREGDICALRINSDILDDLLQRVVGKSEAQRGSAQASRLKWDLQNYNLLRRLIQRGRILSLQNRRCPFLISHWPKQKRVGKTKEHFAQVTPRRLISMFDEARKEAGFTGPNAPVFHGIRSLADLIAHEAGYELADIQHGMAHRSPDMTKAYLEDHDIPYELVAINFTEKDIGGTF